MVTLVALYTILSMDDDIKNDPGYYVAVAFITLDILTLCFIFALFSPF